MGAPTARSSGSAPGADELADLGDSTAVLDDDDQLRLLFLCPPALAEQAQVR